MKTFVYSLNKTLYEGTIDATTLPSADGEIGILPHHVPLATVLTKGTIRLSEKSGQKSIPLTSGFAYTDGTQLVVLANE